jgi:hypothetical protein
VKRQTPKQIAAKDRFHENERKKQADKKQRQEMLAKAEALIRSEQAQASPEHQGMAIGLMLGAEKNPDLRGLVAGLAGLKDENETEEK